MNIYNKIKKIVNLDKQYKIMFNLSEKIKKESLVELSLNLKDKNENLKMTYEQWDNIESARINNGTKDKDPIIINGDELYFDIITKDFMYKIYKDEEEIKMAEINGDGKFSFILTNDIYEIQDSDFKRKYKSCMLTNENFKLVINNLNLNKKEILEIMEIHDYNIKDDKLYMNIIDSLIEINSNLDEIINKKEIKLSGSKNKL